MPPVNRALSQPDRQAVVVLSNNDGCIVARSAEARALGIAMGTPYFKARRELQRQNVVVRSSNYALYADMSQRMMSLLNHCEELEIYSIDEAFGRISRPRHGDLEHWSRALRARLRQDLGLPIAIGVGASKGQAKLANRLAKQVPAHAGVFDLGHCDDPDGWLETIAIEDVWGIGRKLARWCRLRGVSNARLLRDMPGKELRAKYGVVGRGCSRNCGVMPAAAGTGAARSRKPASAAASADRSPRWRNCARPSPPTWCAPPKRCASSVNALPSRCTPAPVRSFQPSTARPPAHA